MTEVQHSFITVAWRCSRNVSRNYLCQTQNRDIAGFQSLECRISKGSFFQIIYTDMLKDNRLVLLNIVTIDYLKAYFIMNIRLFFSNFYTTNRVSSCSILHMVFRFLLSDQPK